MGGKPGATRQRYTAEVKARAIAYAKLHGRKEACEKLGIPKRTMGRWLPDNDPETARYGPVALPEVDDRWARRILNASVAVLEAGATQLLARVADGGEISPKDIHAWGGIMKLANDAETTQRLLEERKKPNNSQGAPARPKPAPVVPIESREQAA
jgi:hypothetical protein